MDFVQRTALAKQVLLPAPMPRCTARLSAIWKHRPRVMPTETLTCQELVELVTDYLEQALSSTERARFEAHIAQCQHCPTYLDQMRTTIRILGKLTTNSLSPAAQHELLACFRDWKRQRTSL